MLAVATLLLAVGAQVPARELEPALPTLAELGEGALDNDVHTARSWPHATTRRYTPHHRGTGSTVIGGPGSALK